VAGLAGGRDDRQCRSGGDAVSGRPIDMSSRVFRNARILIVDDEPGNVDLLRRLLERAGFSRLESTNDSREAVDLYVRFRPDLILLDLHMPHRDGLEVMDELNQIAEASYLPILMLTGDDTPEAKREALSRGAKDFLNKPFHSDEVLLRIGTLLETRFLYLQIQSQNQILEAKVRDRTRELEAAQIEIIERLARAAEFRDDNTGQHTERVGQMAALLARQIGLSDTQVSLIRRAAPLHDVGKIGIPDSVLLKLGKLTPEEFELVKTHTSIGARILSGSRFTILRLAEEIAFNHHERWDGHGYVGIVGSDIPLAGRIVALADVFDALTQKRPYKSAWTVGEAIAEIDRQRGQQFDPALVDAFLRVIEQREPQAPVSKE
jgi:putative two-component system response regulator